MDNELKLKLGDLRDFDRSYTLFSKFRVAIIRNQKLNEITLQAVSLVCTHQSCVVERTDENNFICPCHGAIFNSLGVPVSGPAKRDLEWRKLEIDQGELYLYPSKKVNRDWKLVL